MQTHPSHILVPIDFSEQSIIALSQSYNMARLANSDITLIHVLQDDHLPLLGNIVSRRKEYEDLIEDAVSQKLQHLAKDTAGKSGLNVNILIRKGKVYEEIVNAANDLNSSFIIMGTNGSVGLRKRFIGSNALRVIKEAQCPVITIKGKQHNFGCKNIVLPLDLSKESREKVNKAVEIAKYFDSTIHVVSVVEDDDEFRVTKLRRQLAQVKSFIEEKEVKCTTKFIVGGDIAKVVNDFAKETGADLTMIMTQQERNWTDLFIGSQAQEVINNSEIPVLSIRPMVRKDTTVFTPY
jgi:nucleotide-binding universal stress UspA family protein